MDVEIRTIAESELEAWVRVNELAFGGEPEPGQLELERSVTELDRAFAAVEDGEIVGTAAAYSLRMRVPGGADVPTAGVTMVGVKPSHRRRGINTAMMRRLLDQARGQRSLRPDDHEVHLSGVGPRRQGRHIRRIQRHAFGQPRRAGVAPRHEQPRRRSITPQRPQKRVLPGPVPHHQDVHPAPRARRSWIARHTRGGENGSRSIRTPTAS